MKILFVASECAPFAKAGGLGDVVGALPKALKAAGHDVRVLIPRYGHIVADDLVRHVAPLAVPLGGAEAWCGVLEGRLPGSSVPIYFLEHDRLYGGAIYEGEGVHGLLRFGLLSRAAFQLCRAIDFIPDIFHAHDWPTALVPVYLDTIERGAFPRSASVYTIHNIAYQPRFPPLALPALDLPPSLFRQDGLEDYGQLNPFKAGLYFGTQLTTVSPTYANEISTSSGGAGLDGVIRARAEAMTGILNGIDEEAWDPKRDPYLPAHFDADDLQGKVTCKTKLQAEVGLEVRPDVPLLGVISRLTYQKGIDVVASVIDRLLGLGAQLVVLGSGDAELERTLVARSMLHDGRFVAWMGYNEGLAHRIEAAADLFLMPSRFEPCGLNQMYSQRYGTLPVVRATGGLADTVEQCEPGAGKGTGFKLYDLHPDAMVETVRWALETRQENPSHFRKMQRAAMTKRQGWEVAALAYLRVYAQALGGTTAKPL